MKIIVLGSNGMLGSMIVFLCKKKNYDCLAIGRYEFDVLKHSITELEKHVKEECVIVNCIGAIPQKKYNEEEFEKLNKSFPLELAEFCKNRSIPLLHISTNCVFSGEKRNYIETDEAKAHDVYGRTKKEGEPEYGVVLRTSIIGFEKNYRAGLLEWFLQNESGELNGYVDSYWNGLTTLEFAKVILEIIDQKEFKTRTNHFYSENTVSKYELLEYVNNKFRKGKKIVKKESRQIYSTLSSLFTKPRKNIFLQIDELHEIYKNYINL
jgi:dTDP-4-dehydrorhamnose reductase